MVRVIDAQGHLGGERLDQHPEFHQQIEQQQHRKPSREDDEQPGYERGFKELQGMLHAVGNILDHSGKMVFQSSFILTMDQPSLGPSSRPLASLPMWDSRS